MTKAENTPGGLEVVRNALMVAHLPIGQENIHGNKIGPGYQFRNQEQVSEVARQTGEHTRQVTNPNAAFCGDERIIKQLGDITDSNELMEVVTPQLFGGTNLAATKAAVAANIAIVRDAKNFVDAYDRVRHVLSHEGFEDAGHKHCGGSICAPDTARDPVDPEMAYGSLNGLGFAEASDRPIIDEFADKLSNLHSQGFFEGWSNEWHEDRLWSTYPKNFAILESEDDATKGHHGSGLLVITEEDMGLAKNEFVENTGTQLFAYTSWFADRLASKLSGSPEEHHRLNLSFGYDALNVGNQLYAKPEGNPDLPDYYPGMAVLKQ